MDNNFTAWAFPAECNSAGRIKEISGTEAVRQSIKLLLETNPGERFFYREYGAGLDRFTFSLPDYATLYQIKNRVKDCIEQWEKRAKLVSVDARADNMGKIVIDIIYSVLDEEFQYTHELLLR